VPSTEVMHKWGAGELHSGSKTGPVIPHTKAGQRRAVAIMLSEKRKEQANGGTYPERKMGIGKAKKAVRHHRK